MSDKRPDPGGELWERLVRQYGADPTSLSQNELTYFAVCLLDGETFVNGYGYFFQSAANELYENATSGLKDIGAEEYLAAVHRGNALLIGQAQAPAEPALREYVVLQIESRQDEALDLELKGIARQMFDLSEGLGAKLEAYARHHGFWPGDAA